jgi:hypothetical protein
LLDGVVGKESGSEDGNDLLDGDAEPVADARALVEGVLVVILYEGGRDSQVGR